MSTQNVVSILLLSAHFLGICVGFSFWDTICVQFVGWRVFLWLFLACLPTRQNPLPLLQTPFTPCMGIKLLTIVLSLRELTFIAISFCSRVLDFNLLNYSQFASFVLAPLARLLACSAKERGLLAHNVHNKKRIIRCQF